MEKEEEKLDLESLMPVTVTEHTQKDIENILKPRKFQLKISLITRVNKPHEGNILASFEKSLANL